MKLTRGSLRWPDLQSLRPRGSFPYALVEGILIVLLAIQGARLVWAMVAPFGPIGNWTAGSAGGAPDDAGNLTRFDPFFRLSAQAGPAVVTSAPIKLFGVRVDQATGGGSAIIATPDGVQSSFGVGEAIMPGMILKAVMADHITVERNGTTEELYLDQSVAAPVAQPGTPPAPVASTQSNLVAPGADALKAGIGFAPRLENGAVTGFLVSPKGDGAAFRAMGLQPGDVLTQINGLGLRSLQDASDAISALSPNGAITLVVERAGTIVTLNARGAK